LWRWNNAAPLRLPRGPPNVRFKERRPSALSRGRKQTRHHVCTRANCGLRRGLPERPQQTDCGRCPRRNEQALSTHTGRCRFLTHRSMDFVSRRSLNLSAIQSSVRAVVARYLPADGRVNLASEARRRFYCYPCTNHHACAVSLRTPVTAVLAAHATLVSVGEALRKTGVAFGQFSVELHARRSIRLPHHRNGHVHAILGASRDARCRVRRDDLDPRILKRPNCCAPRAVIRRRIGAHVSDWCFINNAARQEDTSDREQEPHGAGMQKTSFPESWTPTSRRVPRTRSPSRNT